MKNNPQNIYDNKDFFDSYKALREADNNYNILLEQPAMKELLPELSNKSVLDLGCGFGNNCMDFVKIGAKNVVGIDVSKNMLSVAGKNNCHNKIEYINMPIENLSELDKTFDFVYSSLCFNYVEDFNKLINDIYNHLNANGILLFSQEHPIVTAVAGKTNKYIRDGESGELLFCLGSYQDNSSRRVEKWFVDGVIKYHRTFSNIINSLCDNGFVIEKIVEPIPSEFALEKREGLKKEFVKPTFLIIKAYKQIFE